MNKKLILIAMMMVLCTSLVSAVDYYFVIDNGGTAKDVADVINTIIHLKDKGALDEGEYKQYANGELTREDFTGKIGTFVYKGEASIIVGDSKYDDFAEEVKDSLKKAAGIDAEIILLGQMLSDDLIKTIEKYKAEETEEVPEENITEPAATLYELPADNETEEINDTQIIITQEEEPEGFFAKAINWIKGLFGF